MSLTREQHAFIYYMGYLHGRLELGGPGQIQPDELNAINNEKVKRELECCVDTEYPERERMFWQFIGILDPSIKQPAKYNEDAE